MDPITASVKLCRHLKLDCPQPKDVGVGNRDHGNHLLSLNFPFKDIKNGKIQGISVGRKTLGCYYVAAQKTVYQGRARPLASYQHAELVDLIWKSLVPYARKAYSMYMDTMTNHFRVDIMRGARTKPHTDGLNSLAPNFLLINDEDSPSANGDAGPGCLFIRTFPKFRSSVVSYQNTKYIPMRYSEQKDTLTLLGIEVAGNGPGEVQYHNFEASVVDELEPVGDLSFAVVGIKKGMLQIMHFNQPLKVFHQPLQFDEIPFAFALREVQGDKVEGARRPLRAIKVLRQRNAWQSFFAWKYIHWWVGDPMALRVHVYVRVVKQIATGGTQTRFNTVLHAPACPEK